MARRRAVPVVPVAMPRRHPVAAPAMPMTVVMVAMPMAVAMPVTMAMTMAMAMAMPMPVAMTVAGFRFRGADRHDREATKSGQQPAPAGHCIFAHADSFNSLRPRRQ